MTQVDVRGGLDFYGHFSGNSSYPVVCRELLRWLLRRGIDVHPIDLREHLGHSDLPRGKNRTALVFAFPTWYSVIPRHEVMIGYHVCDTEPPAQWYGLICRNVDVLLTPSEWSAECLRWVGLDLVPIHVVRHGVNPTVFCPGGGTPGTPGPSGDKIKVRHYGSSASQRKGTLDVVSAALRLLGAKSEGRDTPRQYEFDLSVNADLGCVSEIDGQHGPCGVILAREESPREASKFADELRSADVVLQPSNAEGFGLIPLQAVACGTPVVMTAATGHREFIESLGDAAVTVRPNSPEDISRALSKLDPERLKKAAAAVSEHVRTAWSWSSVLDRDLLPLLQNT